MRKAITPVISVILLLVMTVAASGVVYIWMTSVQTDIQESAGASIEGSTLSSCSQLQLISMRGDEVVVQNVGCDTISDVTVLINGVLTNYDLTEPLTPGDATTITFTAGPLDEDLSVIVALSNGVASTATITNCTETDGCSDLDETFEEHSLLADVADDADWTNVGDQDVDANATILLRDGDFAAYFVDLSSTKIADKMYTISSASPGTGNTTIEFNIDFGDTYGQGSRGFVVVFYDAVNTPIQAMTLGNGFMAVVEAPSTIRDFWTEPGGGGLKVAWDNPTTYEGKHDYTLIFNEDAETIRYFIDGVEIYATDGATGAFDGYFQTAGAIAKFELASGFPAALTGPKTEINTDVYVDDINFDWI